MRCKKENRQEGSGRTQGKFMCRKPYAYTAERGYERGYRRHSMRVVEGRIGPNDCRDKNAFQGKNRGGQEVETPTL